MCLLIITRDAIDLQVFPLLNHTLDENHIPQKSAWEKLFEFTVCNVAKNSRLLVDVGDADSLIAP